MSASTKTRRPRTDPVMLAPGCDLYESKVKGLTVVITPAAQTRLLMQDPMAALRITIPWPKIRAAARRCGGIRQANAADQTTAPRAPSSEASP
jgi:hypothetical protein